MGAEIRLPVQWWVLRHLKFEWRLYIYEVDCGRFISGRQLELGLEQRHLAIDFLKNFYVLHPLSSKRGTVDVEIKVPFYLESRSIDAAEVG